LDKYKPILLLSAVILIIIIGYYTAIMAKTPVVDPRALGVEIDTDGALHLLGEEIEVGVYLYNDRLTAVRIEQEGLTVWIAVMISSTFHDIYSGRYFEGSSITVPAKSRILWGKITFTAEVTGSYVVECLGEKAILNVVFQREDFTS
jgi:hypothetical protein